MEWPTFTDEQVIEEAKRAAGTIRSRDVLTVGDGSISEMLGYIPEVQYHIFLATFTRELVSSFKGDYDTQTREEGSGVEA